jgi:hypothetical protein
MLLFDLLTYFATVTVLGVHVLKNNIMVVSENGLLQANFAAKKTQTSGAWHSRS